MGFESELNRFYSTLAKVKFSEDIVYTRGLDSVPIKCSKGTSRYEVTDFDSVRLRGYDADFCFLANALDFGAGQVEPERGDTITWSDSNGFNHTFEVWSMSDEPWYRYTDPQKIGIRIHTTEVIRTT